ncbi:intraflagellar transport protein 25 homolog [Ornithorhynchus anatinus]|uniref:intraflagellar transport protein 25 homolog n=1 Tax=Ornithorhynchus anatinus TaxID=9258 RepID=UPI0010A86C10|nr:intraflagellar transport protein 25 homolog [Ornithorhynchus anatinus]
MGAADLCRSSEGARLVFATSFDQKHPPENILDGNSKTFWITTGMFPQEFLIGFRKQVKIYKLTLQCYFVRSIKIEKSVTEEPWDLESLVEKDLTHTEGQLQTEEFIFPGAQATFLRFIIQSAFDNFVSVYRVSAEGTADSPPA